ncbi:hypothetical protein CTAYLR_007268 [Chrysophaeum taylorii]|uniref:Nitric oxide synthase-interacting protein zinc-finger domain-containing protein n=1 Tax=Chrysophaeum taylorii TaxID=2483200 RepID=A0AAD7UIQ3_9STRA|nr:hypothetical protein CTAYLR_007268 [Chrysophaeum taylorii]
MPQRHSKNNGSSTYGVFSYHERRQCEFMSSKKSRLGTDAQLPFGYCHLSLQPAVDPVVTPSGHIYSRESILEHLVTKAADLKRRRDAWEAEKDSLEREASAALARAEAAARDNFDRAIAKVCEEPRAKAPRVTSSTTALVVVSSEAATETTALKTVDKPDANFWLPQLTPSASGKVPTPEPPRRPPSPTTGAPLRAKDLVPIDLRRADSAKATGGGGADVRFLCHVSNDEITTQPVVFIRSTGCVMIEATAKSIGVLDSKICPVTSRKFKDKDLVRLVTGTSAYAASGGDALVVKKYRPGGGGA